MRKVFFLAAGLLVAALLAKGYRKDRKAAQITSEAGDSPNSPPNTDGFKISSPAFKPGQRIPTQYACDGGDQSPPLQITGTPGQTESLALVLEDPDSPLPPVFDHWLIWNIPADTTELAAGNIPVGAVQGKNTLKNTAYNGPCTPNGTHHYHFKLYALDCQLSLEAGAGKGELETAMKGHILAKSEMVGTYTANNATRKKLAVAVAGSFQK